MTVFHQCTGLRSAGYTASRKQERMARSFVYFKLPPGYTKRNWLFSLEPVSEPFAQVLSRFPAQFRLTTEQWQDFCLPALSVHFEPLLSCRFSHPRLFCFRSSSSHFEAVFSQNSTKLTQLRKPCNGFRLVSCPNWSTKTDKKTSKGLFTSREGYPSERVTLTSGLP